MKFFQYSLAINLIRNFYWNYFLALDRTVSSSRGKVSVTLRIKSKWNDVQILRQTLMTFSIYISFTIRFNCCRFCSDCLAFSMDFPINGELIIGLDQSAADHAPTFSNLFYSNKTHGFPTLFVGSIRVISLCSPSFLRQSSESIRFLDICNILARWNWPPLADVIELICV